MSDSADCVQPPSFAPVSQDGQPRTALPRGTGHREGGTWASRSERPQVPQRASAFRRSFSLTAPPRDHPIEHPFRFRGVLQLYRAPFSTNVERVALALAHKGLSV